MLDDDHVIPAWSAFHSITSRKQSLCEVNVGYLPAITDRPTKYETVCQILKKSNEIMHELELNYIFLEVDQAIYHKVLDVMFQLPDKFQNVIIKMRGFHIVLCMMRSIYSRFRGFRLVDLVSLVGGPGGPGTIESALKGGHVKTGIRLYKLLFEAFYRISLKLFTE